MIDRSQPLVVTPQACPFVALDGDRDQRLSVPDPMHRCFADATPKARSMGHQASYCLTGAFTGCPIFLDWASRVAADVVATGPVAPGASSGGTASIAAAAAITTAGTAGTAGMGAPVPAVATETRPDPVAGPSSGVPAWVAEAVPPPPDSMDVPSRRTARVVIDTSAEPGAGAPGAGTRTPDVTIAATATLSTASRQGLPPAPAVAAPDDAWSADGDSDAAAELAASMARTDLRVDGDPGSGEEPRASIPPDEDGTEAPPWSRGRPRVPVDAGAPATLGPQTRPAARPSGPREWEGARRFEAYAAKTGSRQPGRPMLVAIGVVLVGVALLSVFLLPSLFRGGGAAPTTEPTSAGSGLVETGRPRATPTAPGATPERPRPTPGSYRVKRGDTLSSIGRKFNVTVAQLTCANDIRNSNLVTPGTILIIPIESYQCPRPTKKPGKTPRN